MKRHGKKRGEIGICVYCGKERRLTREHVFPRGLFLESKPRPSTPVLVPACEECNGKKAGDDSYMRDVINFDASCSGHPITQANIRGQIARSIQQNYSELAKAVRNRSLFLPKLSDEGKDLGYHLTIPLYTRRLNRWCEMIARGLYFAQAKERLPDDYVFEVNRIRDSRRNACFHDFVSLGAIPYRMGAEHEGSEDVVGWTYLIDFRDKYTVMWLIWFYKSFLITISCMPPDSVRSDRQTIEQLLA